jgi:hypothetical protein
MFYIILLLVLFVNMFSKMHSQEQQTSWDKMTAEGFPIYNGQLETTEGFGAYLDYCLKPGTKNFDNGGGTYDFNSQFLKKYQGVTNVVYDPFQRDEESNLKALAEVSKHDFDTATSNSVLNVIDSHEARQRHIALSCHALKEGGIAYFKVFSGNGSGNEHREEGGYQSNRLAATYQADVEEIFGKGNVVVDKGHDMIIAYKNSSCQKAAFPAMDQKKDNHHGK